MGENQVNEQVETTEVEETGNGLIGKIALLGAGALLGTLISPIIEKGVKKTKKKIKKAKKKRAKQTKTKVENEDTEDEENCDE